MLLGIGDLTKFYFNCLGTLRYGYGMRLVLHSTSTLDIRLLSGVPKFLEHTG